MNATKEAVLDILATRRDLMSWEVAMAVQDIRERVIQLPDEEPPKGKPDHPTFPLFPDSERR